MAKIKIDMDMLCEVYPEARKLEVLPRKKKKALKKKIEKMIVAAITSYADVIISNHAFHETIKEMEDIQNKLEGIQNGNC